MAYIFMLAHLFDGRIGVVFVAAVSCSIKEEESAERPRARTPNKHTHAHTPTLGEAAGQSDDDALKRSQS